MLASKPAKPRNGVLFCGYRTILSILLPTLIVLFGFGSLPVVVRTFAEVALQRYSSRFRIPVPVSTPQAVAMVAPLRVRSNNGLSNRLRVILSYLQHARDQRRPLHYFWIPSAHCNQKFEDLFKDPPEDLQVFDAIPIDVPPQSTIETEDTYDNQPLAWFTHLLLTVLHPRPRLQARIDELLLLLRRNSSTQCALPLCENNASGTFTSVHLRRTDLNADYSQDARVADWALSGSKALPGEPIFVAADNALSLGIFKSWVSAHDKERRVVTSGSRYGHFSALRLTSIEDAVVDLWVSSFSRRFRGTWDSSFSNFIESMRVARNAGLRGELGRMPGDSPRAWHPDFVRPPRKAN